MLNSIPFILSFLSGFALFGMNLLWSRKVHSQLPLEHPAMILLWMMSLSALLLGVKFASQQTLSKSSDKKNILQNWIFTFTTYLFFNVLLFNWGDVMRIVSNPYFQMGSQVNVIQWVGFAFIFSLPSFFTGCQCVHHFRGQQGVTTGIELKSMVMFLFGGFVASAVLHFSSFFTFDISLLSLTTMGVIAVMGSILIFLQNHSPQNQSIFSPTPEAPSLQAIYSRRRVIFILGLSLLSLATGVMLEAWFYLGTDAEGFFTSYCLIGFAFGLLLTDLAVTRAQNRLLIHIDLYAVCSFVMIGSIYAIHYGLNFLAISLPLALVTFQFCFFLVSISRSRGRFVDYMFSFGILFILGSCLARVVARLVLLPSFEVQHWLRGVSFALVLSMLLVAQFALGRKTERRMAWGVGMLVALILYFVSEVDVHPRRPLVEQAKSRNYATDVLLSAWPYFLQASDAQKIMAMVPSQSFSVRALEVLSHKKVEITQNRSGLIQAARSPQKYDLIVSDPSGLENKEVFTHSTLEFYELVREVLKRDGVFSQSVNIASLSVEEGYRVFLTFFSVFQYGAFFGFQDADTVVLIGSQTPLQLNRTLLSNRFESLKHSDEGVLKSPVFESLYSLLATFIADRNSMIGVIEKSLKGADETPLTDFDLNRIAKRKIASTGEKPEFFPLYFSPDVNSVLKLPAPLLREFLSPYLQSLKQLSLDDRLIRGMRTFEGFVKKSADPSPKELHRLADLALYLRRYESAYRYALLATQAAASPDSLNTLLESLIELDRYPEALKQAGTYKKIGNEKTECLVAEAQLLQGRIKDAERLAAPLETKPEKYQAICGKHYHRLLGSLDCQNRKFESAISHFEALRALNEFEFEDYRMLMLSYFQTSQPAKAEALMDEFNVFKTQNAERVKKLTRIFQIEGFMEDSVALSRQK